MRIYDHLFFDLDNTLWDFTANSNQAMQQTLHQLNILSQFPSFDEFFDIYEQINQQLWNDYHLKKISKQTLIVERFSQSFQHFGISGLDWVELNRRYLDNMALQTRLFPKSIETLSALKAKGYQMHIITNGFREVQHRKLANCGLTEYFTRVFISEELHTTKPHPQIFKYALSSCNSKKSKSIMIGDSWETDIVGAMNFGIDQIMFLNNDLNEVPEVIKIKKNAHPTSYLKVNSKTKTYFITEISDLLAIL